MLLAALVLAKAVLLADLWPAINRYPDRPLVYNVLWKTLIYSVVATLLHYLENLIDFWREAGSFMAANRLTCSPRSSGPISGRSSSSSSS